MVQGTVCISLARPDVRVSVAEVVVRIRGDEAATGAVVRIAAEQPELLFPSTNRVAVAVTRIFCGRGFSPTQSERKTFFSHAGLALVDALRVNDPLVDVLSIILYFCH